MDFRKRYMIPLEEMPDDSPLIEGMNFYLRQKKLRAEEVTRHQLKRRFLEDCTQKTTPKCSCGENHKGLSFFNLKGEVVEENMCPRSWWVKMVILNYERGNAEVFVKNLPLDEYMKHYEIG